MSEQSTQIHSK